MSSYLETFRGVVYPVNCDAMGHLTIKEYMGFFDQAEWHCFLMLGFDPAWIRDRQIGWADVRHVVEYKQELLAGDLVQGRSEVIKLGSKSLTTRHELLNATTGAVCATLEAVTVQYDLAARKSMPLVDAVREAASRQLAAAGAA